MPSQTNSRDRVCFRFVNLLAIFLSIHISCGSQQISVCTYNLWNVMFSWEIRMRHIADMVNKLGCEVLIVQEVRLHGDRSWSQASFLQQSMRGFHWMAVRRSDQSSKPLNAYWTGWEGEGLAVLSKFPTGEVWVEHLSKAHGPDTNQRIALHVPIIVDSTTTVNVIAVHFSYHRQQQCQNAAEILTFVHRKELTNVVVAGDFNTYPDFTDPVDLFLRGSGQPGRAPHKCQVTQVSSLPAAASSFQDAWEATHEASAPGLTFSNMPTPGLISRPDRILTSSSVRVLQSSTHGEGTVYKTRHSTDIFLHRLHRVLYTSKDTYDGHTGYPCLQDCGPRGACRCGVCVTRENFDSCQLPDCEECSAKVFVQTCAFLFVIAMLLVLAGIAAVRILIVASRMDQSGSFFLLGCTCCLCNPRLVRQATVTGRHCTGRLLRGLGVGKLPPAYLLFLSLTLVVLCFAAGGVIFKSVLDTVSDVMPEEYFPSDHLMLVTKLEIKD